MSTELYEVVAFINYGMKTAKDAVDKKYGNKAYIIGHEERHLSYGEIVRITENYEDDHNGTELRTRIGPSTQFIFFSHGKELTEEGVKYATYKTGRTVRKDYELYTMLLKGISSIWVHESGPVISTFSCYGGISCIDRSSKLYGAIEKHAPADSTIYINSGDETINFGKTQEVFNVLSSSAHLNIAERLQLFHDIYSVAPGDLTMIHKGSDELDVVQYILPKNYSSFIPLEHNASVLKELEILAAKHSCNAPVDHFPRDREFFKLLHKYSNNDDISRTSALLDISAGEGFSDQQILDIVLTVIRGLQVNSDERSFEFNLMVVNALELIERLKHEPEMHLKAAELVRDVMNYEGRFGPENPTMTSIALKEAINAISGIQESQDEKIFHFLQLINGIMPLLNEKCFNSSRQEIFIDFFAAIKQAVDSHFPSQKLELLESISHTTLASSGQIFYAAESQVSDLIAICIEAILNSNVNSANRNQKIITLMNSACIGIKSGLTFMQSNSFLYETFSSLSDLIKIGAGESISDLINSLLDFAEIWDKNKNMCFFAENMNPPIANFLDKILTAIESRIFSEDDAQFAANFYFSNVAGKAPFLDVLFLERATNIALSFKNQLTLFALIQAVNTSKFDESSDAAHSSIERIIDSFFEMRSSQNECTQGFWSQKIVHSLLSANDDSQGTLADSALIPIVAKLMRDPRCLVVIKAHPRSEKGLALIHEAQHMNDGERVYYELERKINELFQKYDFGHNFDLCIREAIESFRELVHLPQVAFVRTLDLLSKFLYTCMIEESKSIHFTEQLVVLANDIINGAGDKALAQTMTKQLVCRIAANRSESGEFPNQITNKTELLSIIKKGNPHVASLVFPSDSLEFCLLVEADELNQRVEKQMTISSDLFGPFTVSLDLEATTMQNECYGMHKEADKDSV